MRLRWRLGECLNLNESTMNRLTKDCHELRKAEIEDAMIDKATKQYNIARVAGIREAAEHLRANGFGYAAKRLDALADRVEEEEV